MHSADVITSMTLYEKNEIAFVSMDVTFAILNFVMAYKMLKGRFANLQKSIQRVLVGFYIVFTLQVCASIYNLCIVFSVSNIYILIQAYVSDAYARVIDWVLFCMIMILFFKLLFQLKYVEI